MFAFPFCLIKSYRNVRVLKKGGGFMMNLCVFVGPEKERKVPRSGFRRLGKHHMTADVFSLAVGPAAYHSFEAGWVHCRLCHVDVEINLRGQSAWKTHWRSKNTMHLSSSIVLPTSCLFILPIIS